MCGFLHLRGGSPETASTCPQVSREWGVPRPLYCHPHPHPPLADKDRDRAKDKYVRSLWKLFAHHNRYVLGVRAAQLHHQHHHQLMLPGLLQSLQDLHQEMACIL